MFVMLGAIAVTFVVVTVGLAFGKIRPGRQTFLPWDHDYRETPVMKFVDNITDGGK